MLLQKCFYIQTEKCSLRVQKWTNVWNRNSKSTILILLLKYKNLAFTNHRFRDSKLHNVDNARKKTGKGKNKNVQHSLRYVGTVQ
jgi:hypothetical protein